MSATLVVAQEKGDNKFFDPGNRYWTTDVSFGVIAGWENKDVDKMGDQINVGLSLGLTRTFESNLFASVGASVSFLEETELWDNPLDYFSINIEGGYQFRTGAPIIPYVALGASYINAPNTIADSKSSLSFNPSAGLIMWFKNSKLAMTVRYGLKLASNDYMETHKQLMIGLSYRL